MQTKTIHAWVLAARLRTLPLSVSGIIVGSALGYNHLKEVYLIFSSPIFWLAILTTLGLQILSNFANDYGDGVKGTDNNQRIGPKRAIQSGLISKQHMKIGITLTAILTLIFAIFLIYIAFGSSQFGYSLLFLGLGILSIIAAIKYTVGQSAYGYKGLGDIFVFLFFGLVSTIGSFVLVTQDLSILVIIPAISIGCLSTSVLNLNNMRDIENDKASNKNTLVVKMGLQQAKVYHYSLIGIAILMLIIYTITTYSNFWSLLPFLACVPLVFHINTVRLIKQPVQLDPELKKVALTTVLLSILLVLALFL